MGRYGDEGKHYSSFVCVESVIKDAVELAPKASWKAAVMLVPLQK